MLKILEKTKLLFNKKRLFYKYRFIIQNEDTFEDKLSIRISRINLIVASGFISVILIGLTSLMIFFTPLREYIPGYTPIKDKQNIEKLLVSLDSITQKINNNDNYIYNFKNILTGEIQDKEIVKKSNKSTKINNKEILLSKEEINFRKVVEEKQKYDVFKLEKDINEVNSFFPPVTGVISSGYSEISNHKAIDLLCKENTPIKSILKGTVLFSEWSIQNGYVIIISHSNNIISVYKHNSKLLKKQGDFVNKGEVIAFSGSKGEYSTGPHLHFELWIDNIPVNPIDYISF